MTTISIREALSFGWTATTSNFGLLIGAIVIMSGISFIPSLITEKMGEGVLTLIIMLVGIVIQFIVNLGIMNIALKLKDGFTAQFSDLFAMYPHVLKFLAASFLLSVGVGLGLLLFIIPGILLAVRCQFFSYLIIDKGAGPITAIKESWRLTSGQTFPLLGFSIVCLLLNILGALFLGIGILITLPITLLAGAHVYRILAPAMPADTVTAPSTTPPLPAAAV